MEEIVGYVQSIVFYNESSKYTIARLKFDQKKDEKVTIVGYFEPPKKHELCRFIGDFIEHPKFGRQFQIDHYEKVLPTSKEAIVRFLSSALFPGVGVKAATVVVEALGEDCLQLIKNYGSVLDNVNIKHSLKPIIRDNLNQNSHLEEAIKIFVGHGIEMKYLIKMDATYGANLIDIVMENPYQLIKDIDGMNFKTVDKIAHSLGILDNDSRRLSALLVYVANQLCFKTQDTYLSSSSLFRECLHYQPDLTLEKFDEAYNQCLLNRDLISENQMIFPYELFHAETSIAHYLSNYLTTNLEIPDPSIIDDEIKIIENKLGILYSHEQKNAIHTCLRNGLSIITGGPGTGKTTVVNAIIQIYRKLHAQNVITLCAPTGRAAKRLTELTGVLATTIHRILKWDLDTNRYGISEDNPLDGDFLIVDEFSMVDCQLFYHLLAGTHPYRKILLIGDDQQLPPVSPGDVLRDLLESELVPTTKLISIFRQGENSGIIPLCYDVRRGQINRQNLQKDDVHFYDIQTYAIKNIVLEEIEKAVDRGYSQQDIQVLAPMYDGIGGITNLNDFIREYFNPPAVNRKEIKSGRAIFREKDKVIQLKNQPDDDVYNGDIGFIESIEIDEDDKMNYRLYVNFDQNIVTYTPSDIYKLSHAYCISVHKSQGSEYRYVIMPILKEHRIMLRRKLIYTGISRAKEELLLIGNLSALEEGVAKLEQSIRKTTLKSRLKMELQFSSSFTK